MPILEIEVIDELDYDVREGLAARLADAAGEALGASVGGTWVRLRTLPAVAYAESGGGPPPGIRPVFVSVVRRALPETGPDPDEVLRLTQAIARECRRPEGNVHVRYEAPGAGRQAFGGTLAGAAG